jgi:Zn-dependent protease
MTRQEQSPGRTRPSQLAAIGAIGALLAKTKFLFPILKLLKFSKPFVTLFSMAFSALAYALTLGPWFGVGFVTMLFLHEMGHVIALRLKGLDTPGPVFVPFLGAAVFVADFRDRDTEAFIGFGGPLVGMISALACFAAWFATGQENKILLMISYSAVFLNLVNLIPISPLDGGRITQAIGGWFRYIGIGVLAGYILVHRQPSLIVIMMLALTQLDRRMRPLIGGMLLVGMAVLDHYAGQDLSGDLLIGVIIVVAYCWHARGTAEESDSREYPSPPVRTLWLLRYAALLVVGLLTLSIQTRLLPY